MSAAGRGDFHVNLDDPRISSTDGEPVFLPQAATAVISIASWAFSMASDWRRGQQAMFAAFTAAISSSP